MQRNFGRAFSSMMISTHVLITHTHSPKCFTHTLIWLCVMLFIQLFVYNANDTFRIPSSNIILYAFPSILSHSLSLSVSPSRCVCTDKSQFRKDLGSNTNAIDDDNNDATAAISPHYMLSAWYGFVIVIQLHSSLYLWQLFLALHHAPHFSGFIWIRTHVFMWYTNFPHTLRMYKQLSNEKSNNNFQQAV